MVDWTKSMSQTFEYYIVNPLDWQDSYKLNNITSCNITYDSESDVISSATFDGTESLDECYIRVYLKTIQNGVTDRFPLGTFLAQPDSSSNTDSSYSESINGYSPLIELKDDIPPYGYNITKEDGSTKSVMEYANELAKEHLRAPIVDAKYDHQLQEKSFVSNTDDTWFIFIKDLLATINYHLSVNELGYILFVPDKNSDALQPVMEFNEDLNSIICPDITTKNNIYKIPNVLEVIYSSGGTFIFKEAINDLSSSPISIQNRGRIVRQRLINPKDIIEIPTSQSLEEYAKKCLKQLSTIQYEVSYKRGYYPLHIGDCIKLNYPSKNLNNVKAVIKSQSIKCEVGCEVSEKAVYTKKLLE